MWRGDREGMDIVGVDCSGWEFERVNEVYEVWKRRRVKGDVIFLREGEIGVVGQDVIERARIFFVFNSMFFSIKLFIPLFDIIDL